MKNNIVVSSAFLLLALNVHADSQKTITSSDISGVKVFLSGAEVSRTFKSPLEEGVNTIVITNLSSQIDKNSITASVTGGATILNTSYMLDYLKENRISPQLKTLKDSAEALNDNMNELNLYENVYNEEIAMLNSNKEVGGSNVGVNADNLHKVMDFYRQRMIEVRTRLMEVGKKKTKLAEIIRRINDQINEENGRLNRPYGAIIISVSAKQAGTGNFELSYYSRGASWRPSYEIRSNDIKSPVSLLYKASVTQFTGEDWNKTHVKLSTGNPSVGGTKPNLVPWYLRIADKQVKYRFSPESRTESYELQGVAAPAIAADKADTTETFMWQQVQANESQLVNEFDIKIPYSILSDGKEVLMDIQSYTLDAAYDYYLTPKIDKDAFLMANITGWEKLNLLPGNANVYLENSYVGQSYVNPGITDDTLKLSFGRDKRIIVKREMVKDMNTTKFFGGNVEKEFLWETSVRNSKKDPVTVTIEDQLPLSTDENIKITNGELSSGSLNAETGMITWKIDLKPGESKAIRFGYKIRYPKDKRIIGL